MRDDEARLAEWRRRGREMGLELAVAAKQAIEAGELVEVCTRALAETTVRLAGECASAGAARDEMVAYVNELVVSFGETNRGDEAAQRLDHDPPALEPEGVLPALPHAAPPPEASATALVHDGEARQS
jgi:hypothetical protein